MGHGYEGAVIKLRKNIYKMSVLSSQINMVFGKEMSSAKRPV